MWSATLLEITVDGKPYMYDPAKLMNTEAKAIQRFTGLKMSEFQTALGDENIDAITALVWLVRKRAGEVELVPEDVEFDLGSINIVDLDKPEETDVESDPSATSPSELSPPTPDES